MDRVSVIMPCYNDGKYIMEAVKSVESQTYPELELIIVDDGSDDSYTLKVLGEISIPWAKVIRVKKSGPSNARNVGISAASGTMILPLDSDDTIDSSYIEKAVKTMEANPNVGVVYCQADLFGEKQGRWNLPDYSLDKMLLDNIVFVTALFYKADWEKVGGFHSDMVHGMEDYDFWLSILELDKDIYQIPEVLFHYRIKPKSRTTSFANDISIVQQTYRDIYMHHQKLYTKYADKYAMILREALIEQSYKVRAMTKGMAIVETLDKYPLIKRIIKKFIVR